MVRTINQVQLVGNLARDPEYSTTQSGITKCSFTVACQRPYKNQNGSYDADFINCVAWRQTADFVNRYFLKGNKIGLTGSLQVRSYEAQDGSKRWITEVVVNNVEFVAPRSDGGQQRNAAPAPSPPPAAQQKPHQQSMNDFIEVDDDELPFDRRVSLPTQKGTGDLWSNGVIYLMATPSLKKRGENIA